MWVWYGRLGCFVFVQTHALVLNVIDLSLISCLGANSLSSQSTNSLVIYCTKARYYEHYCYVLFAFSSFFPTFVCSSYHRLRACRFCCWCSWPCYFEPFLHKLLNFFVIYFSLDLFFPRNMDLKEARHVWFLSETIRLLWETLVTPSVYSLWTDRYFDYFLVKFLAGT